MGSYVDSVSQADPASMTRLMHGLDEFLERDQDRALFNLAPRQDLDKNNQRQIRAALGAAEFDVETLIED